MMEDDSLTQTRVLDALEKFEYLLERVQGVPLEWSSICYEFGIAYNVSHLMLRGCKNLPLGGHHKSASILHKSLHRAFEALEVSCCQQHMPADITNLFSASNMDHTIKHWLPSLLQALCDNEIGSAPLISCCSLLAFLWLLDECVNRLKAVELLTLIHDHLKHLAEVAECSSAEEVQPGRCPVYLFSLEYTTTTVTNCIVTSSTADVADTGNLLSVVTSLLAFSHFANKDYHKVLATLPDKTEEKDGFSDAYLKGYVSYMQNEVDKAQRLFQLCAHISQGQQKAAALIMLGCCCAVKGKHHTAVAKFKEAMRYDFQQLEALFNISLQYRTLGNTIAEMQCLKLLKQAISIKVESKQCCNVAAVAPFDPTHDLSNRILELTIPPQFPSIEGMLRTGITTELITYTLAKRSAELGRFEEAANSYIELLANIVGVRSLVASTTANPASPIELYRQSAVTLLKAARYQDTLTVCDKLLITADCLNRNRQGSNEQNGSCVGPRKRLRSNQDDTVTVTDEETVCCEMLVLKAEAFIHLNQPLQALQSLNRVLGALEGVHSSIYCSTHQSQEYFEEQQRKRRRIEIGANSTLLREQEKEKEPNELLELKVRAYLQKASILEGLGQTHDALHQLHLSLECLPDHTGTVYKHTQLLFKLGSKKEAVNNWLGFRGIKGHQKEDFHSIKKFLSAAVVRLDDSEDVTLEQVQAMDDQVLNWCSKTGCNMMHFSPL